MRVGSAARGDFAGGKKERRVDGWVAGRLPVCFVEDDELLPALGKGYFLLGEAFDAVADDVDAWCVCV